MSEIGAYLICLSVLLMWASKLTKKYRKAVLWTSFGVLIVVGVLDISLLNTGQQTITQFIQSIVPQWVGLIMVVFFVFTLGFVFGIRQMLPALLGVIAGHLFWS